MAQGLLADLQKKLRGNTKGWPDYGVGILCPNGAADAEARQPDHIRFTWLLLPPILIFERQLVYLPEPHRREVGTWVREQSAVAAFAEIFDSLWAAASPQRLVSASDESTLRPADAELLQMLVKGLTSSAIARRLGVSLRTVERRICRLSRDIGANGRIQLVSEAARRSWV